MDSITTVPPAVRAVLNPFIDSEVQRHFGDAQPSAEELYAFYENWIGDIRQVPLMDGTLVTITGEGGPVFSDAQTPLVPQTAPQNAPDKRRKLLVIPFILAAVWLMFGNQIAGLWQRGNTPETPPEETSVAAPAGVGYIDDLDALVTSGDVRAPLLVPRTLEIAITDVASTTTFIVVPQEVEEAEWPCNIDGDERVACWVEGTITNYLIGIPETREVRGLAHMLTAYGGEIVIRMSTGPALRFNNVRVQEVSRQRTELLAQNRFGVTVPLLGGEGDQRLVILADYDASQDIGAGAMVPVPTGGGEVAISMGEAAILGTLTVIPMRTSSEGRHHVLRIAAFNEGPAPVSATWQASVAGATGAVSCETEGGVTTIIPGDRVQVICSLTESLDSGPTWRVVLPGGIVVISP